MCMKRTEFENFTSWRCTFPYNSMNNTELYSFSYSNTTLSIRVFERFCFNNCGIICSISKFNFSCLYFCNTKNILKCFPNCLGRWSFLDILLFPNALGQFPNICQHWQQNTAGHAGNFIVSLFSEDSEEQQRHRLTIKYVIKRLQYNDDDDDDDDVRKNIYTIFNEFKLKKTMCSTSRNAKFPPLGLEIKKQKNYNFSMLLFSSSGWLFVGRPGRLGWLNVCCSFLSFKAKTHKFSKCLHCFWL